MFGILIVDQIIWHLLLEVEQCEKTLNTAITWIAFSKYILSQITNEPTKTTTTVEDYQVLYI